MKNFGILGLVILFAACTSQAQEKKDQQKSTTKKMNTENVNYATFGGGCFWCTEAIFDQLEGVEKVESGYSGGHVKNPAYREVTTGSTGHAEVIHITFKDNKIDFETLAKLFFE